MRAIPGLKSVYRMVTAFLVLSSPGHAMTWPEAMQAALQGNRSLKAARLDLESAHQALVSARSDDWPALSLASDVTRVGTQIYGAGTGSWYEPGRPLGSELDSTSYGLSLQAGYKLFSGFQSLGIHERAVQVEIQQKALYDQASLNVRASLHGAYNQLLYAEQRGRLLKQIKERLSRHTGYVRMKYQSGQEARWAWLQAQADEKQVDWQIKENSLNLRAYQASLSSLTGGDPVRSGGLKVEGVLETPRPPELDSAREALLDGHPTLRRLRSVIAASSSVVLQGRSHWYPDLSAFSSYGYAGGSSTWPPRTGSWNFGLRASYELFSGWGKEAAVHQAEAALDSNRYALAESEAALQSQLYLAWGSYTSAWEKLPVSDLQLEAASDRLKTSESLYVAGRKSFFEFEQAQSNLTSQLQQALSSRLELARSSSEYEKALGLTLEDGQ